MLPMIHWQIELFYGHLSCSAGQSTEATHLAAKWSLSDRFMYIPTTFSVTQMDRKYKDYVYRKMLVQEYLKK